MTLAVPMKNVLGTYSPGRLMSFFVAFSPLVVKTLNRHKRERHRCHQENPHYACSQAYFHFHLQKQTKVGYLKKLAEQGYQAAIH
jgi:hypothetical protein